MAKPGMIYVPLVFLAHIIPEIFNTGFPLFYYFVFLLIGYFFILDKQILESIERHRYISLIIGLCSLLTSKFFSGRRLVDERITFSFPFWIFRRNMVHT